MYGLLRLLILVALEKRGYAVIAILVAVIMFSISFGVHPKEAKENLGEE